MTPTQQAVRDKALRRCRERGIVIPTLAQQQDPTLIPEPVRQALRGLDMQARHPLNLFRITWKNDPGSGGFGAVNHVEIPSSISGVRARIIGLAGCHFPTGAHKVGAAFGCLVPRLVRGEFDPTSQLAVWPSTGNYCRGGAFDSALLGCRPLAILPEEMSRERFQWLEEVGAEIMATPGCESNVKEIFDACWRIRAERKDAVVFNQFDEFGNYLWHYAVTGSAVKELAQGLGLRPGHVHWVGATGSGGTLAAGDRVKDEFPGARLVASEALQCPTLLLNGFGGHRIEGIGDKHVPWIHNARNTDAVAAIDDEDSLRLLRLFNEPAGHEHLASLGVADDLLGKLPWLGISSICNLLTAVKTARWFELDERHVIFTSFTDSAGMYLSRLDEMRAALGAYDRTEARVDHERRLLGQRTDMMRELGYPERKALHNLKYFTWVEQQGRTVEELNALWDPAFWEDLKGELPRWDEEIERFNRDSGAVCAGA
jgi:cysteine synthase A